MKRRARYWVLCTHTVGRTYWFRELGAIGPRCTEQRSEAARFKSRREAMRSSAYWFAFTNFEPEAVR